MEHPRPLFLFLLIYSVLLACLLSYQSLWVDEIIQLLGTRSGTLDNAGHLTRTGVGGVPLGWLPQLISIRLLGYSTVAARLPSALAAVATCLVLFFTARQIKLSYPLIPAVVLGLLPLHFRYALEGRPYAQGVLLSALATLLFLRLLERPSLRWTAAYTAAMIVAMYSQPLTIFTGCAHLLWSLSRAGRQGRLVLVTGGVLAFTALTFLPWYVYASPMWEKTIRAENLHFQLTLKTPLMLIREITGAGYCGGAVLLLLAVVGFRRGNLGSGIRWLLLACSIVPVVCVLAVDAFFSYFLAIRQMIFVLPPLVLLAAEGLNVLTRGSERKAVIATAVLSVCFVVADINWLRKPREDWALAARAIETLTQQHRACAVYAPPDSVAFYALFVPQLTKAVCPAESIARQSIIVATTPYATEQAIANIEALVKQKSTIASTSVGMSAIRVMQ